MILGTLPLLDGDAEADTIIEEESFSVLESSYSVHGTAVLVVYWNETEETTKHQVLKTDDYFRDTIIAPFRKCISNITASQTNIEDFIWYSDHLQEIYVNKFHLSPNDVWKY
jgi:hypothetical protein